MSRTRNSFKNIKFAIIGQAFGLIISFISRKIFVISLGTEYLGVNGLFSNILSILSLAELGIGTSIIYALYKPIADENIPKINSLMNFYKNAYRIIGLVVLILGLSITPFLALLIKDLPEIPNIYLIYIIYVANSVVSYFFIYKRSLIIANEKRYVTTIYRYACFALLNILQILVLIITKKYLLYISLSVIITLIENVLVSKRADKMYPYLKEKDIKQLNSDDKKEIKKNVGAMFFHKVGGVVISGTDNLLMATLVNVISVGLYSNYVLITAALTGVIALLFQSVIASIGNLNVSVSPKEKTIFFNRFFFAGAWIYGFCFISLLCLFNPFIKLWLGNDYMFSANVVTIISINFFITGMRQATLTTRDAMGLFWHDRYKPILESIINLVASIILAKQMGVFGILLGTFISTMLTCFWIEPLILYKYGLHDKLVNYYKNYFLYTVIIIIALFLTYFTSKMIISDSLASFILKLIVCATIPNLVFIILFSKRDEFQYFKALFVKLIKGKI